MLESERFWTLGLRFFCRTRGFTLSTSETVSSELQQPELSIPSGVKTDSKKSDPRSMPRPLPKAPYPAGSTTPLVHSSQ